MKLWINAAAVRAVKTFAQAELAQLRAGVVGILDINWVALLSVGGLAAVLSVLTSLAGLPEVAPKKTDK